MTDTQRPPQRVVCAANRLSDGTIFVGVRHWDQFMRQQAGDYIVVNGSDEVSIAVAEQGFVDQWGTFLTRSEAWIIAEHEGQIHRTGPGFSGPELYSENLY